MDYRGTRALDWKLGRMKSPISRAGFVVAVIGGLVLGYMAATHMPLSWQRPHSPQYYKLLLDQQQRNEEIGRQRLAAALAGKPIVDESCAADDDECATAKFVEDAGFRTAPLDQWARWTPEAYARAWWGNMTNRRKDQRTTMAGVTLLGVGAFLCLLYGITIGRLFRWIQHGNAPRDR